MTHSLQAGVMFRSHSTPVDDGRHAPHQTCQAATLMCLDKPGCLRVVTAHGRRSLVGCGRTHTAVCCSDVLIPILDMQADAHLLSLPGAVAELLRGPAGFRIQRLELQISFFQTAWGKLHLT